MVFDDRPGPTSGGTRGWTRGSTPDQRVRQRRALRPEPRVWPGYHRELKMVAIDNDIAGAASWTMPDHIDPASVPWGPIGYRKPACRAAHPARPRRSGREAFDRALREYIRRWAFKHPTPSLDFFRTIENVSGQDLSWFWRSFFYTSDVLDIGIDSVASEEGQAVSVLHKLTSIPYPVTLRLALSDGVDAGSWPSRSTSGHSAMCYDATIRGRAVRHRRPTVARRLRP